MTQPKTLLRQLKKNRNILREREAKYGRDVPLELLNQLEDHDRAIALTEQVLAGDLGESEWREALQPLLLAVQGGQVVNIEAETYIAGPVQGDVVGDDKVLGDKIGRDKITHTQINIGLTEIEAPDRAAIAAYLTRVIESVRDEQQSETQQKSAALQRLWSQTFYGRRPGQTAMSRRSLDEAIQERLSLKRPAGVVRRAVALLADAGGGKTPAFQHILSKIAEKSRPHYQHPAETGEQAESNLIPILIRLTELRPGQQFLPLVRAAYNRYAAETITLDQTQKLLDSYECLLMIDDLDKVTFSAQQGGIQLIREFMDNNPQERYVISCRTSSYHEQLGPMDAFVLDELSDEQVQAVLGDAFDPQLLPLARNRAMLQILITEGPREEGQWSRGRLLQRMVWAQLRLHQDEVDLELEMVETLLERLAYRMHSQRAFRYSEQQLMAIITDHLTEWHEAYPWRGVTRLLRQTGVMRQNELRQWRFHNRSTQAYFVAAAIYHDPTLLPAILDHAADPWWRESLEILVGLLDDPSELLFGLIDRDALVAAHCLQFVGQAVEQRVINAVIDGLIEQMRYERAVGREEVVRLFSKIGYLPPQPLLWQLLYRERKSLVLVVLAQALADSSLRRKQYNFSPIPETETTDIDPALQEVINLWQEHTLTDLLDVQKEIEAALIARLASGGRRRERVRGLAAIVLGHIGIDVDKVHVHQALLVELTRPRLNTFVAWCVTDALGQIKHQTIEQAALQLYQTHRGRSSRVAQQRRVYAVYLLGAVGGRFAVTAKVLYEALADADPELRGHAAYAIGRLGLLGARERLEARLENRDLQEREQENWALRRTVGALGRVGTLESIRVLEPYLRHEQRRTRQRVRESIAEIRRRYELT